MERRGGALDHNERSHSSPSAATAENHKHVAHVAGEVCDPSPWSRHLSQPPTPTARIVARASSGHSDEACEPPQSGEGGGHRWGRGGFRLSGDGRSPARDSPGSGSNRRLLRRSPRPLGPVAASQAVAPQLRQLSLLSVQSMPQLPFAAQTSHLGLACSVSASSPQRQYQVPLLPCRRRAPSFTTALNEPRNSAIVLTAETIQPGAPDDLGRVHRPAQRTVLPQGEVAWKPCRCYLLSLASRRQALAKFPVASGHRTRLSVRPIRAETRPAEGCLSA